MKYSGWESNARPRKTEANAQPSTPACTVFAAVIVHHRGAAAAASSESYSMCFGGLGILVVDTGFIESLSLSKCAI